ncbi:SDR family NAD(P)-dependent oxidoreductase [Tateyamaria sp.]|uniref:SDR family NAD(P)-dependent oxidoreductase n=1 Tax=Tateyamaria sp. TaxID=1929288 RepID=UPI00329E8D91
MSKKTRNVLVTGTAGFIGFHLAQLLTKRGFNVLGYDAMTDYTDVALKERRHQMLAQHANFRCVTDRLEDMDALSQAFDGFEPDVVVHLAAQAGVRYSLEQPRAYIESNIVGTFNVIECARKHKVDHLLMASTSSVYGSNTEMPFSEQQKCDTPLSIYAATKMAGESLGHSHAHLWNLPTTMFRFFTVYGPWGRPDMAMFKFTKGILEGTPIDIYNHGDMYRDFTYVEDLVEGIYHLIDAIPPGPEEIDARSALPENDSISPVAPFRVVNIGTSTKVRLIDYIEAIEAELGIQANRNYMGMQPGDVPATWADASLLESLTGQLPTTPIETGVKNFVAWYLDYHDIAPVK